MPESRARLGNQSRKSWVLTSEFNYDLKDEVADAIAEFFWARLASSRSLAGGRF
jgi:hypothetical protein